MLAVPANNIIGNPMRADGPVSRSLSDPDEEVIEANGTSEKKTEGFDETLDLLLSPPQDSQVAVVDDPESQDPELDIVAVSASDQSALMIPSSQVGYLGSDDLAIKIDIDPPKSAKIDVISPIPGAADRDSSGVLAGELTVDELTVDALMASRGGLGHVEDPSTSINASSGLRQSESAVVATESQLAAVADDDLALSGSTPSIALTNQESERNTNDASKQNASASVESVARQLDAKGNTPKPDVSSVNVSTMEASVNELPTADVSNNGTKLEPALETSQFDPASFNNELPASAAAVRGKPQPTIGRTRSTASNQISNHILSARQSLKDGKATLEVRLDPPELGKITIELTETQEKLTAKVFVAESATLDSIKSSMPTMIESLADAGISLDNFQLTNSESESFSPTKDSNSNVDVESDQRTAEDQSQPTSQDSVDAMRRKQHQHTRLDKWGTKMEAIGNAAATRDQFMQLLVTQLRNQDPLEPTKQEDFLAQLAQFSTLEETQKLNEHFEGFLSSQVESQMELQQFQNMTSAATLVGKGVEFKNSSGVTSTGQVDAVVIKEDAISLRIGEELVPISHVQEISSAANAEIPVS